ncbi:hypothetical protein [Deinococcus altitudinis]|uniref:hypothetical protein n=1 Tax=Deinococcus altitudinis TaxID=468914 RepID=UPI0038914D50
MTAQQADDATYQAAMQRNALVMYPEDVTEFRDTWATASVDWIRAVSEVLTDKEIDRLSGALRTALLTGKADLTEIWRLAALKAGVL